MRSTIETMIGLELARERRAGVDHFAPGQHGARRVDPDEPDLAEVWWVDGMGHAWLVLCAKTAGAWLPQIAFRGGQETISELPPPRLNASVIAALEGAA